MSDAPPKIYLQIGHGDEGGHTWCSQQTEWEPEIEYIRADIDQPNLAERTQANETILKLNDAVCEQSDELFKLRHDISRLQGELKDALEDLRETQHLLERIGQICYEVAQGPNGDAVRTFQKNALLDKIAKIGRLSRIPIHRKV